MKTITVLLVLGLGGCWTVDTPRFTEGDDAAIDASLFDAEPDAVPGACPAEDPATQSSDCPAEEPICDPTGACRACTRHYECASGACYVLALDGDPVGQCVSEANVAYINAADSAANTACTRAEPCRLIGLAPADLLRRHIVVAPGIYVEDLQVGAATGAAGRYVIGYGAELRATSTSNDALTVVGGDTLGLYGLSITSSSRGIVVNMAMRTIVAEDLIIADNSGVGTSVSNLAEVHMTRSRVLRNDGGGVHVTGAHFVLTSSFVNGNGGTGGLSDVGGVLLDNPTVARLAFNTITDNQCSTTTCDAPGIECIGCISATEFHSNIITGNTGSTTAGTQVNVVGNTPLYLHCLVNPMLSSGMENIVGDPGFQIDGVHLSVPTSPAVDEALPQVAGPDAVLEDIDGQPRPLDQADIGADECVPDATNQACE